MKYLLAKTDPWNPDSFGACVPMNNMFASQKNHAFFRSTVTLGENGYAYVAIAPCLANNTPCFWITTNLYNGTTSTNIDLLTQFSTGMVVPAYLQTPYSSSDLKNDGTSVAAPKLSGRIVSAGFRYWYSGTELERSGWSASFVTPQHGTLENKTFSNYLSYVTTNVIPTNNRKKHQGCVFGIRDVEMSYAIPPPGGSSDADAIATFYPYSNGSPTSVYSSTGAPIALIMFKGNSGQTFEFEYCQHNEYVGEPAAAMATKNASDPQGAQMVNEATQNVADDPSKETTTQNVVREMKRLWSDHKSHAIQLGVQGAYNLAVGGMSNLLMG